MAFNKASVPDHTLHSPMKMLRSPDRIKMSEAGVYTVKNGKIVREEFLTLEG